MTEIAHSVKLNLFEKLQNKEYRRKFFWAETSARIAAQLIALRKRRGLNQKEVAELTGTKQPAISRVEQADYQNWNMNTLRSIAEALDARIRVLIEPAEDILKEYGSNLVSDNPATATAIDQKTTYPHVYDLAEFNVSNTKSSKSALQTYLLPIGQTRPQLMRNENLTGSVMAEELAA